MIFVSYGTDTLHAVKKHGNKTHSPRIVPELTVVDSTSNEPSSLDLPPRAWRKVYEKLRPSLAKKRRAHEFNAVMKREITNPIGYDPEEAAWRREMAAIEGEEKETAAWRRKLAALDREEKEEFSLQDALDYLQPREEDDDKEDDKEEEEEEELPIPTFLLKKEKVVKVVPQSELRLFRPGMI
ncbi:hypothetical protein SNOG_00417 [Parastagonospora nodorum SN15]|uniref:Uncharacterized protein n=1 Tax=Phaeosphaeria nodorum (strain SN15 / ATCC MYA-4574 / FGSC 10173) TaxID=321614 RepID=Q0V6E7_PHANO|nr:hypothetical protein SNOG_00417 [Parastagonospora nodorum SN15]EAT91912.2 hypothetical protein SNOG_00417 [Parastagonospora nodorum SN15]